VLIGATSRLAGSTPTRPSTLRAQPATIRASSTNGVALDLVYCFNVNMDLPTGNCGVAPVINNGNVVQIKNNLNTADAELHLSPPHDRSSYFS